MIDHNKLLTIIKENYSFVLTSHVNPDADAIGSEIALYNLLNKLEKKVRIINHSATPYNLKFLDEKDSIEKFDQNIHSEIILSSDVIFFLDLNNLSRVVSMQSIISRSNSLKVCIDHHQSPEEFADYFFLDADYAATGEILLDFMKKYYEDFITKEIAIPLYAAIMTDTGSFRFERTTPKLHRDVAYLIEKGVNPFSIYDQIYDQSRFSKIKLLGKSLTTINLLYKNKLAYMIITQNDFLETQAEESDTDNFVNYNLSIEGVILGLLFIELKNGFKISFRSKGNIRADLLAQKFGGGGHKNASGARFYNQKMTKEIIESILNQSVNFLIESGE